MLKHQEKMPFFFDLLRPICKEMDDFIQSNQKQMMVIQEHTIDKTKAAKLKNYFLQYDNYLKTIFMTLTQLIESYQAVEDNEFKNQKIFIKVAQAVESGKASEKLIKDYKQMNPVYLNLITNLSNQLLIMIGIFNDTLENKVRLDPNHIDETALQLTLISKTSAQRIEEIKSITLDFSKKLERFYLLQPSIEALEKNL
jgi:hypothetical protein